MKEIFLSFLAKISPWYNEEMVEKRERLSGERIRRADMAYVEASKILSTYSARERRS